MHRKALLSTAFLLLTAPAVPTAAVELRAGGQLAGHLLFTDVLAAEVQWPALRRPDQAFLREIALQSGLGLSLDGRFLEIPLLARFELVHAWRVGFELAPGLLLSHFRGTSAMTPLLCTGLPITIARVRIQPEYCANITVGPGRLNGLWTGLGLGVFHAF